MGVQQSQVSLSCFHSEQPEKAVQLVSISEIQD
jgi:hypothetical protein